MALEWRSGIDLTHCSVFMSYMSKDLLDPPTRTISNDGDIIGKFYHDDIMKGLLL